MRREGCGVRESSATTAKKPTKNPRTEDPTMKDALPVSYKSDMPKRLRELLQKGAHASVPKSRPRH